MDKVSEYLISMITKQVENSGIVVWYDPEKNYTNVINELNIPETTILGFENSFFNLSGRRNKPSRPKCCIKYDADMLKNLCKATRFDYDTHDCTFNL